MSSFHLVRAFRISGVGPAAKLAAVWMADGTPPQDVRFQGQVSALAKFCGCHYGQALDALDELLRAGFLADFQISDGDVFQAWFTESKQRPETAGGAADV